MRMLSRSAQNWNQEFTFDSELAEISGVQNRGIPLFLFFLRSTLAVYIGVIHLFRARSLMPVRELKARGDEENKEKEVATVYHNQVDGYPDNILLFIVIIQIYIYIYLLLFCYFDNFIILHFTILL